MVETRVEGVELWAANTDTQALGRSKMKGALMSNIGSGLTQILATEH